MDKASEQTSEYVEEKSLEEYWLVLRRHWLPACTVLMAITLLGLVYALLKAPQYRATGTVLVQTDRSARLTGLGDELGRLEALQYSATPLDTQVEVIRSVPVLEEVIQALDLKDKKGDSVEISDFLKQLTVRSLRGADVISISYVSPDPEEAAAVVNAIAESYIKNNVISNQAEAFAARSFIDQQLPRTEADLFTAENQLRQFRQQYQVLMQEGRDFLPILTALQERVNNNIVEIDKVTSQLQVLQSQLGIADADLALMRVAISESSGIALGLGDYYQIESELADQGGLYTEESPVIELLNQRKANIEKILRERIAQVSNGQSVQIGADLEVSGLENNLLSSLVDLSAEKQVLAVENERIDTLINSYRERVDWLPQLQQQEEELVRNVAIARQNYENLISRLQETQIAENQSIGNARVLSPALVPKDSAGSSGKMILAAAMMIGTLSGLASALGLDWLDKTIKTVKEAEELFDYTLLGVIPLAKDAVTARRDIPEEFLYPRLRLNQSANSGLREAYQMLQANLKFLQSDAELKMVVVTSTVASEGKSEVAANLAMALSQGGRRVLLVDADMRQPSQHHTFELLNQRGLSHVVTGQTPGEAAIQSAMDNLDVLTAGVVPPNPLELVDSRRMEALLRSWTQEYDMVILDTPPLVGYADAAILGKMADGVLLVARPGVVNYQHGRIAKNMLTQSNQRILGLVVNGVNPRYEPVGYFGYARQEELEASASIWDTLPVKVEE
jgi:succinoglycan biosynthesis transport protein ExoP